MFTRLAFFALGALVWTSGAASCAPRVPGRSPATSPLSTSAPPAPVPEIATSLTRDPLAAVPPAGPDPHAGHGARAEPGPTPGDAPDAAAAQPHGGHVHE